MGAPKSGAPEWSAELVVRAVRRSLGLVALSYAPYFPAIFDRRLSERVRPPSGIGAERRRVAAPWPIRAAGKLYFVPGSLEDLLDHTSAVVAAAPAIGRAWSRAGIDADCGPPSIAELEAGRVGERPWKAYWNDFHRRSGKIAAAGRPWVLNADVERCAERIDAGVLANELAAWEADRDAVRAFESLHRAWSARDFPGLPVTGTFALLTRMYLLAVEERLREDGVVFLRALDDFRIFCRSPEETERARRLLREALAVRGLRLNEGKCTVQPFGTPRSSWRRWRSILRGKVRYGLVRPVLVGLTRRRAARPAALAALRLIARPRPDAAPAA